MTKLTSLRTFLFILISGLTLFSCGKNNNNQPLKEIKIGIQKSGPLLYLREKKILENHFKDENIKITWIDFSSGPPMLEALNTGSIDFCTTGDTPPIFAQAANVAFYYIASEPTTTNGETLVVPQNSSIKTLKDIKGKRIAVTRGSSAHYTLSRILEKAGYQYNDITTVYLSPSDARAAFESGDIDGWVIWEPFLSAAEIQLKAKVIDKNVRPYIWLYLSSKNFADKYPKKINELIDNLKIADEAIGKDLNSFSKILSKSTGLSQDIAFSAVKKFTYNAEYLNQDIIEYLQQEANSFSELKLIPKPIKVEENVWDYKKK